MTIKEPFNEYLSRGQYMSPSAYKTAKNPSEVWYFKMHPEPATDAMTFGHLVHTIMLEPERIPVEYVVDYLDQYPVQDYNINGTISMRSKMNQRHRANLSVNAQLTGKELITDQQFKVAMEMKTAFEKYNPTLADTLLNPDGALIETSFYGKAVFVNGVFDHFADIPSLDYKPEPDEMLVKTRPDYVRPDYFLDVKTCESAYPIFFATDCVNYGYDIQVAFIHDFINILLGWETDEFILLAMEKKPPYLSVPMRVPEDMITTGRAKYCTRLEKLHKGVNNGYLVYAQKESSTFIHIPFPRYAVIDENKSLKW